TAAIQRIERPKHPDRRVVRGRHDLADLDCAVLAQRDEVGEGAADVDPHPHPHRSAPPMRNRLTAPTLTPPQCGVWNAECGIEGAGRSPTQAAGLDHRAIHSALRNPHSAFPSIPPSALSGPPPPPLHRHHAGEPNRGQHAERPTQSPRRTYRVTTSLVRSR